MAGPVCVCVAGCAPAVHNRIVGGVQTHTHTQPSATGKGGGVRENTTATVCGTKGHNHNASYATVHVCMCVCVWTRKGVEAGGEGRQGCFHCLHSAPLCDPTAVKASQCACNRCELVSVMLGEGGIGPLNRPRSRRGGEERRGERRRWRGHRGPHTGHAQTRLHTHESCQGGITHTHTHTGCTRAHR